MVPSYCEYISKFLRRKKSAGFPIPGEHHFVAAYLVPKLFAINSTVPSYINPDGTKAVRGDIVYFKDGLHHFGIEAKLDKVRLTKWEFNKWIVETDSAIWPDIFVGVGTTGVALAPWADFRTAYIASVRDKKPGWFPSAIEKGYGPIKNVNQVIPHLDKGAQFLWSASSDTYVELEETFTEALISSIGAKQVTAAATPVNSGADSSYTGIANDSKK